MAYVVGSRIFPSSSCQRIGPLPFRAFPRPRTRTPTENSDNVVHFVRSRVVHESLGCSCGHGLQELLLVALPSANVHPKGSSACSRDGRRHTRVGAIERVSDGYEVSASYFYEECWRISLGYARACRGIVPLRRNRMKRSLHRVMYRGVRRLERKF